MAATRNIQPGVAETTGGRSAQDVSPAPSLAIGLRALNLPSFVDHHAAMAVQAEQEGLSFPSYLHRLVELELDDRHRRKIERLVKSSRLPAEKTLATLQADRLPVPVRRQLPALCEGGFAQRAENVLVFGLPGRGKTHLVCSIGHELLRRGRAVLFTPTYRLVQQLLVAKRELQLERMLKRLDAFDALILDDLGYVQQDRAEMEVLFTLLAERYERRSVLITSNLVFSQWDRIFHDAMTTAAAIDRLVHHAVILELTGTSYRTEAARQRSGPSLDPLPRGATPNRAEPPTADAPDPRAGSDPACGAPTPDTLSGDPLSVPNGTAPPSPPSVRRTGARSPTIMPNPERPPNPDPAPPIPAVPSGSLSPPPHGEV